MRFGNKFLSRSCFKPNLIDLPLELYLIGEYNVKSITNIELTNQTNDRIYVAPGAADAM